MTDDETPRAHLNNALLMLATSGESDPIYKKTTYRITDINAIRARIYAALTQLPPEPRTS